MIDCEGTRLSRDRCCGVTSARSSSARSRPEAAGRRRVAGDHGSSDLHLAPCDSEGELCHHGNLSPRCFRFLATAERSLGSTADRITHVTGLLLHTYIATLHEAARMTSAGENCTRRPSHDLQTLSGTSCSMCTVYSAPVGGACSQ